MKQLKMLIENTYEFYENVLKMKKNQYRHILRSQLASFGYIDAVLHDLDRYDVLKKIPSLETEEQTIKFRDRVREWIREIEAQFDLVMITEYFDLGLALVAIELCWPLEYVASVKLNEGQVGVKIVNEPSNDYGLKILSAFKYKKAELP